MVERHVQISGLRFIYFMVKNNEYKDYENYNDASGKFIDGDCCGNPCECQDLEQIHLHA